MRKKIILITSWLFVIFLLFIVLNIRVLTTPKVFDLKEKERIALERRVESCHDIEAAYRLAEYYLYTESDRKSAVFWYKKAVELGDENAAHNIRG